ncbi:hypothetical protein SARC_10259, partial [Sphaeroforma arctica JP610]
ITLLSKNGGSQRGGAIYVQENTFADNGACWYNERLSNSSVFNNSVFDSNAASANGGVFVSGSHLQLNNCALTNNTAFTGSIVYSGAALTLNDCAMTTNRATSKGGLYVFILNDVLLNNLTAMENIAGGHGAVVVTDGTDVFAVQSTFHYNHACNFTYNSVANGTSGGALWTGSGAFVLHNVTGHHNQASDDGGFADGGDKVSVTDSSLVYNTTVNQGGAPKAYGAVSVVRSDISSNTAGNSGGAIEVSDSVSLTNSTLTCNRAASGAAIATSSLLLVVDPPPPPGI